MGVRQTACEFIRSTLPSLSHQMSFPFLLGLFRRPHNITNTFAFRGHMCGGGKSSRTCCRRVEHIAINREAVEPVTLCGRRKEWKYDEATARVVYVRKGDWWRHHSWMIFRMWLWPRTQYVLQESAHGGVHKPRASSSRRDGWIAIS